MFSMGYFKAKGDANALNGNCYKLPAGNCILTTDAQIDEQYTETVTITSGVSECKALCKAMGTDCTGYWVNKALTECKLHNT